MDLPVAPPAPGDVLLRAAAIGGFGRDAQHVLAQHVENLRHRHEHRDPARLDLRDDVGRVVAAHEDDGAGQHRRDERRHRLAEHVAERQQVQEAEREERRAPLPVLQHLALDRDDVREDVAVRDDDALRLGGRARREDDLGDVVARDRDVGEQPPARPLASRARAASRPARRRARERRHVLADQDQPAPRRSRRRARENRATRGSRSARRRRRGAGSPRTRRSTRAGSRSRRRPCRLCASPSACRRAAKPRAARADLGVGVTPRLRNPSS